MLHVQQVQDASNEYNYLLFTMWPFITIIKTLYDNTKYSRENLNIKQYVHIYI